MNKSKALQTLKYHGLLGHTVIGLDKNYDCVVETCDIDSARKAVGKTGSVWCIERKDGKRIFHLQK